MLTLGPIGFASPAVLLALVALPVLWFLLRAVPPAPIRRRFPGVALLLGLADEDNETDRTPWWLLLLRCLAVAAAIIGFAGPILNPKTQAAGTGPLLILTDGTWASAAVWPAQIDRIRTALDDAARDGRSVAIASLTDLAPGPLPFQGAESWGPRLAGLKPHPWAPDADRLAAWEKALPDTPFDTIWLSDGLDRPSRAPLLTMLESHGAVRVFQSPRIVTALRPAEFKDGLIRLTAIRSQAAGPAEIGVIAKGRDPAGTERTLATANIEFTAGDAAGQTDLSLPAELRNRVSRFELTGSRSAGSVTLTDDSLKRRKVALISGQKDREGLELLSPLHYLKEALVPTADVIEGTLTDILQANPDVIVLADVAKLSPEETTGVEKWVDEGGMLLRFAGPRLAASDVSRAKLDPLMPVRLRAGGRTVGGAMSWGEPKTLRPFDAESPFYGLAIPDDVTVNAQVMAQPDPDLAKATIASLEDGTPLITRRAIGQGEVVLFHVTANAEWSTLPLSGLFVQMLERLAVSTRPARPDAKDLKGTTWAPEKILTAFGAIEDAGTLPGVPGETLAAGKIGPDLPPGVYRGGDRRLALNAIGTTDTLSPAAWPANVPVEGLSVTRETPLKGLALALAAGLLLVDILASMLLAGRLRGAGAAAGLLAAALIAQPPAAHAQNSDTWDIQMTSDVHLAHVLTGDSQVDSVAQAGLDGLSRRLTERTSVEPAKAVGINLETDELSFFPLLYWPITANEPRPSDAAYAKLNRYLRTGGMILFDTRDADIARGGQTTPEGARLQAIAQPLDIPPLEPIPSDHVLTRAFYLLQDFPGRYRSGTIWVEAAPPDAKRAEGMPFRNLNDGVTPVVIGGNDWASAWALNANGTPMFPIGRGFTGERQREMAVRFGINLVMHVLTGNYKSDQVHVPALLDRLGQ